MTICPATGKVSHESAFSALRQARQQKHRHAPKLRAYGCRDCGAWHLSSRRDDARLTKK